MKSQKIEDITLGIDLGTSSVKVLALNTSGQVLSRGKAAYQVNAPRRGWSEGDPDEWWSAVIAAVEAVLTQVPSAHIRSIGLAGQMHGIVLVDAEHQLIRPALLWSDMRAEAELAIYRQLPQEMLKRLANPLVPGMAGPMLCWLAQHEPENYQAISSVLQPKDWIRLRLTGLIGTERSDASATLLYDMLADDWADDIIKMLGLRRTIFPEIMESAAQAGILSASAAQELGLSTGLPVAAGAGDTAAAALGSGLLTAGSVQLTLGTGAQLIQICERPASDPTFRTHLYRAADGAHWYAMAAVQNAGLALGWVCRLLNASWEELYGSVTRVAPGSDGLLFYPYITRERPHHANGESQGAWLHMRIDHRREHLLHAALEGVAFGIREALDALAGGESVASLRLVGGGGQHADWQRMLAAILHRELVIIDTPDASARGAALLGGLADGIWPEMTSLETLAPRPSTTITFDQEQADLYERLYQSYLSQVI